MADAVPKYFQDNPDVANAFASNNYGMSAQQFADAHYANYGKKEQRVAPTPAPAAAPAPAPAVAPTPAPAPSTPKYLSKDQLDTYLNANYGELSNAFSQVGSQYGFTNLNDFANAHYINHGANEIASGQRSNPFATAPTPAPAPAPAPAPPPATDYAALIANAMKAAGVGAQPPATPPPPAAVQAPTVAYTPVSAQVNQSTDTAAGQIQRLLAEGSPVLDRARSLAEQRANSRGLINSSIGAGAGTAAMIDAAAGIGTSDAGIYSQQRLANQDAANQMELARGNSTTQVGLANARAQNDFGLAGYNNQLEMGRMGYDSQLGLVRGVFDAGVGEQKDYRTADLNDRNDARSSDRAFMNQSRLNEQSFGFDRQLGEETDLRREGIANRARKDEQGFATAERLAGQQFQTGERIAGQEFASGENLANRLFQANENALARAVTQEEGRLGRAFTAEENRLTREASREAASRGLSGQIAAQASIDVARILADPNIDKDNKPGLIDTAWKNARTAQSAVDGVNGTNFADIFPGGPRGQPLGEVQPTPQTQQQIIDQAVNRIVQGYQTNNPANRFEGS